MKLSHLNNSKKIILKNHESLAHSLNMLENTDSRVNKNLLETVKEKSTVYKMSLFDASNYSDRFIELAEFLTNKITNILESNRDEKYLKFFKLVILIIKLIFFKS